MTACIEEQDNCLTELEYVCSIVNGSRENPLQCFLQCGISNKNQYAYLLQTENECLCTLDFINLPCFTQGFLNDISIVIVVLGKKCEKNPLKHLH